MTKMLLIARFRFQAQKIEKRRKQEKPKQAPESAKTSEEETTPPPKTSPYAKQRVDEKIAFQEYIDYIKNFKGVEVSRERSITISTIENESFPNMGTRPTRKQLGGYFFYTQIYINFLEPRKTSNVYSWFCQ